MQKSPNRDSVTDDRRSKVDETICDVDLISSKGKTFQLTGLVVLPMIPAAALLVFSIIAMARSTTKYQDANNLEKSISNFADFLPVMEAFLHEGHVAVIRQRSNQSDALGNWLGYQKKTDSAMKKFQHWSTSEGRTFHVCVRLTKCRIYSQLESRTGYKRASFVSAY